MHHIGSHMMCLIIDDVNFDNLVKIVFAKFFHCKVIRISCVISKCFVRRYFEISYFLNKPLSSHFKSWFLKYDDFGACQMVKIKRFKSVLFGGFETCPQFFGIPSFKKWSRILFSLCVGYT